MPRLNSEIKNQMTETAALYSATLTEMVLKGQISYDLFVCFLPKCVADHLDPLPEGLSENEVVDFIESEIERGMKKSLVVHSVLR